MPRQTASQTIGPFFHRALVPETHGGKGIAGDDLAADATMGERIHIRGRLVGADGAPVAEALVEIWQADANGRYAHPADARAEPPPDPGFRGFGRTNTDAEGNFAFTTVKPGAVPGTGNALQAPHVNVTIFPRSVNSHLFTRLYFSDEEDANGRDPVLSSIEEVRRGTLVAVPAERDGMTEYLFEVRFRGDGETVFFDV